MSKQDRTRVSFLLIAGFAIILSTGCEKEKADPVKIPTLNTISVSDITPNSAKSGGEITDDGGAPVTARGIVWGTSVNPAMDSREGMTSDGSGTGSFTSTLTGLSHAATYYVRAYATNSEGTAYGNQVQFSTSAMPPEVTTSEINDITGTSAIGGGNVTYDGGSPVTVRGVVWSVNENPNVDDSDGITTDGNGSGEFTSELTGLDRETTYYVRAYAENNAGRAYGDQISFTTYYGTVTDEDGNVYITVGIGTQEWMKENLRTSKYSDGKEIPNLIGSNDWENDSTGAFAWYDNNESYGDAYGAMYNWYAVETGKLCPTGWRVPTNTDWTRLTDYLGGMSVAGGKLKETGTSHWQAPNTGATNETGFTALPGGFRLFNGSFSPLGSDGYWWSSTESNENARYVSIGYNSGSLVRGGTIKSMGFSVRCIKE